MASRISNVYIDVYGCLTYMDIDQFYITIKMYSKVTPQITNDVIRFPRKSCTIMWYKEPIVTRQRYLRDICIDVYIPYARTWKTVIDSQTRENTIYVKSEVCKGILIPRYHTCQIIWKRV